VQLPGDIAIFPLGTVLIPTMVMPLRIFEDRYKIMLAECQRDEQPFGINLIRTGQEAGGSAVPHPIGTAAEIRRTSPLASDETLVFAVGRARYRIQQVTQRKPYLRATVQELLDADPDDPEIPAGARGLRLAAEALFRSSSGTEPAAERLPEDPARLGWYLTARLPIENDTKQALLECTRLRERLMQLESIVNRLTAQLKERDQTRERLDLLRRSNGHLAEHKPS